MSKKCLSSPGKLTDQGFGDVQYTFKTKRPYAIYQPKTSIFFILEINPKEEELNLNLTSS